MEIKQDWPKEVKDVARAWRDNAIEAADGEDLDFWRDRLRVTCEKGRWVISDNYEQCAALVYYAESDMWFYLPMYGDEKRIIGGFPEALANAQITWTG